MNNPFQPKTEQKIAQEEVESILLSPLGITTVLIRQWENAMRAMWIASGSRNAASRIALLNGMTIVNPQTGETMAPTATLFNSSTRLAGFLLQTLGAMNAQGQMLPEMAVNQDGSPKLGSDGKQLKNWLNTGAVNQIFAVINIAAPAIIHDDGTVTL